MPNCAIANCKNSSKAVGRANGDVSFHRFPVDPHLKEKWIDATGNKNWFPTKHSTICSIHFDDASLAGSEKNRRLIKSAYPTIHILNTLTDNKDNINQEPTLNKASILNKPEKIKLEKEPCTSKEMPLSPQKKKMVQDELNLAKQKIKLQNIKIKRLREQNRRKMQKILTLVTSLKSLRKKIISQERAS